MVMTSQVPAPGSPRPSLTIVIPAYEEAEAIRSGRLARVIEWGAGQDFRVEVLVVDDGSLDGTAALAQAASARVLRIPHGGKGAALRAGILAAEGEWFLLVDMDQATPIEEAPKLLDALASGADVALGTRGFERPGAPFSRRVMSLGHWALRSLLAGLPYRDTQCGFKAFRREAALEVLQHLQRYASEALGVAGGPCVSSGFDVEFLLVARRMGFRIHEIPVVWHYKDTRRVAKLKDAWRGVADLFAIAVRARRDGYPTKRGGGPA